MLKKIELEKLPSYEIGFEHGIKDGIEKGIQKWKEEAKIEIARNLLKAGADINLIIQSTGLTKKEIEKLKK